MRRQKRSAFLSSIGLVLAVLVAGCGGGSSSPTTVSEADLQKGREFWLSLDAPLRRELAGICLDKQVEAAPPDLFLSLQRTDVDDYVALVNREYEEHTGSASSIEEDCEEAKVEVARGELEQITSHIQRIR